MVYRNHTVLRAAFSTPTSGVSATNSASQEGASLPRRHPTEGLKTPLKKVDHCKSFPQCSHSRWPLSLTAPHQKHLISERFPSDIAVQSHRRGALHLAPPTGNPAIFVPTRQFGWISDFLVLSNLYGGSALNPRSPKHVTDLPLLNTDINIYF